MPNVKQGTLPFASAKRTNSILDGKNSTSKKGKGKRVETPVEIRDDPKVIETLEISSDEGASAAGINIPAKRTRASKKAQSSPGTSKHATTQPSQSEKQKSSVAAVKREHLDVEDKAGRYRRYYNEVRSKMGYMQPVHSEGQNKIHQILRFFDMSYEYGPCIGMTRLERWERAEAFGLNPPVEVRDILLTQEGVEKAEYAQCVLHDEV